MCNTNLSLGHFRDGRPWLKDERRRNKQEKVNKLEKYSDMKTRMGVVRAGWSSPAETRRSWGKDFFLPPNSWRPSSGTAVP